MRKILLAGLLVLLPSLAQAESPTVRGGGPRLGVSIGPDQVVLGGQLTMRAFAPDWSFDPSLELGVGDDWTVVVINLDAFHHFRLPESDWRPYVGGGLGVGFSSHDRPGVDRDDSDTDIGLNAVAGFTIPAGAGAQWFTELRLGIGGLPDLKLIGGLNFRM